MNTHSYTETTSGLKIFLVYLRMHQRLLLDVGVYVNFFLLLQLRSMELCEWGDDADYNGCNVWLLLMCVSIKMLTPH